MGAGENEAEKNGDTHRIAPHCHSALKPFSAPDRARKYASTSASSIATSHEHGTPILRDEIGQGTTRLAQRGRFTHLRTAGPQVFQIARRCSTCRKARFMRKIRLRHLPTPFQHGTCLVVHPFPHPSRFKHLQLHAVRKQAMEHSLVQLATYRHR